MKIYHQRKQCLSQGILKTFVYREQKGNKKVNTSHFSVDRLPEYFNFARNNGYQFYRVHIMLMTGLMIFQTQFYFTRSRIHAKLFLKSSLCSPTRQTRKENTCWQCLKNFLKFESLLEILFLTISLFFSNECW